MPTAPAAVCGWVCAGVSGILQCWQGPDAPGFGNRGCFGSFYRKTLVFLSLSVFVEFVSISRAVSFQPLDIYLGARLSPEVNELEFQQFIHRFLEVGNNGGKMKRISNYVPKGELWI